MVRKGGNSHLMLWMLVLLSLSAGIYVLYATPSENPVSLDVSFKFNYEGSTSGTFALSYEWNSNDVANKSPGTYDITWSQNVAQAQGSPSLSIDYFIKDHFATIVSQQGLLTIDSSGAWEIDILQLAGSFLNLDYAIVGSNDTVNSFVISVSVNKSLDNFTGDLAAYGVTNLSVVVSAKITIPGNMLMDFINRMAEIAKGFISLIIGTGSQIVQLFTPPN